METKPRIQFYGARGSIPVCGSGVLAFGGNTTCLQLDSPNSNRVIGIDAGTGIRHDHPGGAYSYQFEMDGKSQVFSTDIEHGDGIDRRIVEFSRDADILIHDGQYTAKELEHRRGWGHSSYDQALQVAELAGARRLIITHQDPDHDDTVLQEMEHKCRRRFPKTLLAREKMEIEW